MDWTRTGGQVARQWVACDQPASTNADQLDVDDLVSDDSARTFDYAQLDVDGDTTEYMLSSGSEDSANTQDYSYLENGPANCPLTSWSWDLTSKFRSTDSGIRNASGLLSYTATGVELISIGRIATYHGYFGNTYTLKQELRTDAH